ncbi:DUF2281 domain-containing protein [Clostridium nigeriense]|uniref:DUF2281 domain-containing protein n=1 Tax=Clostridium nigeriense TaxID=1805470 RepID=UPI003D3333D8
MELVKKITELSKNLSEKRQHEVIDFIEFLIKKQLKEDIEVMDEIFEDNKEVMKELAK